MPGLKTTHGKSRHDRGSDPERLPMVFLPDILTFYRMSACPWHRGSALIMGYDPDMLTIPEIASSFGGPRSAP